MSFILPTKPIPALVQNPKNLIIMSKPKIGKTSALAALENNLVLDLEEGSDYVEGLKVKAHNVAEIGQIGEAILAAGKPYKYVTIDTASSLEEMCLPYAEQLYASSPGGKNWFPQAGQKELSGKEKYGDITGLPEGYGYRWTRMAFEKINNYIHTWADHVIMLCHIKDVSLAKEDKNVNVLEIDLTGKTKRIVAKDSDAIGYMYRKGNQNILSFKTTDEVACGARPAHLRNTEIVISEYDKETGVLTTHWDRVFVN